MVPVLPRGEQGTCRPFSVPPPRPCLCCMQCMLQCHTILMECPAQAWLRHIASVKVAG